MTRLNTRKPDRDAARPLKLSYLLTNYARNRIAHSWIGDDRPVVSTVAAEGIRGMPITAETTPSVLDMRGEIRRHPTESDREEAFLPSPCAQNHAANLAILPDGTLACVWFGGTMEGMRDISVWMSRLAPGADRWSNAERLSDDPDRSEQNPILFVAPDGVVWLFHTAQPGGRQDLAFIRVRRSTDGGASFGPAEQLGDFTGIFVRQPPVVTRDGTWLLPGFRCVGRPGQAWRGDEDTALVLVSEDQGTSWRVIDIPDSLGAVHMNILPGPGGEMVALYRDRYAEHVRRSVSRDGGQSWSPPAPTDQPNNNSSIQATRLADGRIAMVYNFSSRATSQARRESLYDELGEDTGAPADQDRPGPRAIWGVPRAPLTLGFSSDGGETFPERRDLELGDGYCLSNNSVEGLNREFSYPAILALPDGTIAIAFTYHRRAIKFIRLTGAA